LGPSLLIERFVLSALSSGAKSPRGGLVKAKAGAGLPGNERESNKSECFEVCSEYYWVLGTIEIRIL
jgi:hypothetical protein